MTLEEYLNVNAKSGDFIHVYHDGIADHFRMEDMAKLRCDSNILPLLNRKVANDVITDDVLFFRRTISIKL